MARKKAPKLKVMPQKFVIPETKLTRKTKKFIDQIRAHGNSIEPDSMEHRAFLSYMDNLIRYEIAWAYWTSLGDKPKDMDHFHEVGAEIGRLARLMFVSFDSWQHASRNTFHVPVADVRQIVYDALMANADAMTDYASMSGLARGAAFKKVADELIGLFKEARVQVREEEMDATYCVPCVEEMAA